MILRFCRIQRRLIVGIALLLSIAVFLGSWPGDSSDRYVALPEIAVERKDVVATASLSTDGSQSTRQVRRGNDAVNSVFDANATLASQLHGLRALSDNQDPYATCVLAWALDLCARGPDRVSISEYFNADMKDLDETGISDIAMYLEYQERYVTLCSGLVETDLWDIDMRLLQSARMGHLKSMTLLAQFPARDGSGLGASTPSFLQAHRENAEEMLNDAAESGDPAAIREIKNAYSSGYIISGLGDVKVDIDLAKSMAALHAIALYANQEEKKELDEAVTDALAQMSPRQRLRFDRLAASYGRAYRSKHEAEDQFQLALNDVPEKVCADGFVASGQPRAGTPTIRY